MKRLISTPLSLLLLLVWPGLAASEVPDFVALTKKLKPAVVNISSSRSPSTSTELLQRFQPPQREFLEDFFEKFLREHETLPRKKKSLGSGVIISADGYILTNDHVVDNADEIKVQLAGGKTYPATVQGVDPKLDLALLKIETHETLPTVKLGDSDALEIGEWVMAIGNPFGLEQTVTVGIVSAKGRVIGAGPYDDFIQTDASINPGNSGGPLFNASGEVIGINAAIVAGGQGIGFAIPINAAKNILPQLKATGHVTRGWLGVTIQHVSEDLADSFGLEDTSGALISSVIEDSPAARAGLKRGDIITTLNDQKITTMNDLPRLVAEIPVGNTAQLSVFRDGKTREITVQVGELDAPEPRTTATAKGGVLGVTTMELSPELKQRLNLKAEQGVVITSVAADSPAAQAGLRSGDVVLEYNNQLILSNSDLERAVAAGKDKSIQRLLIQRGDGLFFTTVKLK